MRRTKNTRIIDLVETLKASIDRRRELEKAEKELKKEMFNILGEDKALEAGNLLVIVSDCERTSLDLDKVKELLNEVEFESVKKVTQYQTLQVKQIGIKKAA